MEMLEILATAATVVYVLLAVKRRIWQYRWASWARSWFFVFLEAKLYSNTALRSLLRRRAILRLVVLAAWRPRQAPEHHLAIA